MKKEILQLVDLTAYNRQYEKIHHVNLLVRQAESVLLWGRDNTGGILARFLRGEGTVKAGGIYAGGRKLQTCTKAVLEEHKIFYIDRNAAFMNSLDLAENLFLLKKNSLRKFWLNEGAVHMQAGGLLKKYGIPLGGRERIARLSDADKIAVALVKAAAQGAALIVLHNLLSDCTAADTKYLCGVIAEMEKEGISFLIYDVHGEDMLALADRIVIMDHGEIIKKLTGREEFQYRHEIVARNYKGDGASLTQERKLPHKNLSYAVRRISIDGEHQFDLKVSPGEILLLSHNDAQEQMKCWEAMLGETAQKPLVELCGRRITYKSCTDLVRERIVFWGNKKGSSGLFYNLTVEDNILMPSYSRISSLGFFGKKADFIMQDDMIQPERLSGAEMGNLSEKAEIALILYRWKLFHPKILIVNHILSGLDEELKEWTADQLCCMAYRGTAVILLETAIDDAMKIADRMLVLKKGVIDREVYRQDYASFEMEELL